MHHAAFELLNTTGHFCKPTASSNFVKKDSGNMFFYTNNLCQPTGVCTKYLIPHIMVMKAAEDGV